MTWGLMIPGVDPLFKAVSSLKWSFPRNHFGRELAGDRVHAGGLDSRRTETSQSQKQNQSTKKKKKKKKIVLSLFFFFSGRARGGGPRGPRSRGGRGAGRAGAGRSAGLAMAPGVRGYRIGLGRRRRGGKGRPALPAFLFAFGGGAGGRGDPARAPAPGGGAGGGADVRGPESFPEGPQARADWEATEALLSEGSSPAERAEELRLAGNESFGTGRRAEGGAAFYFREAFDKYSQALDILARDVRARAEQAAAKRAGATGGSGDAGDKQGDGGLRTQELVVALKNNRALVSMQLGNWGSALRDVTAVLGLEPGNQKARLRAAKSAFRL